MARHCPICCYTTTQKSLLSIKFNFQGDTDNILCNIMIKAKEGKKAGWCGGEALMVDRTIRGILIETITFE